MTDGRINEDVDLLNERVRSGKNLSKRGKNNICHRLTLCSEQMSIIQRNLNKIKMSLKSSKRNITLTTKMSS